MILHRKWKYSISCLGDVSLKNRNISQTAYKIRKFSEQNSVGPHLISKPNVTLNSLLSSPLKTSFMQESARVLKRGARFYGLETVRLPNYDGSEKHRDLTQRSATILGACMPGPISEWTDAFKAKLYLLCCQKKLDQRLHELKSRSRNL